MRALVPHGIDDPDLHEVYARNWVEVGGVRVNMISSADGGATAAGLSEGLQTPGDNRIFAVLRDLADVVLVGAATAVAENYRPVTASAERAAIRDRFGLRHDLPIAIASRSLRISRDAPLFGDPSRVPIIYTCESADAEIRRSLADVADVVICGTDDLDLSAVRADLAARGLTRVLCEGGPTLFGAAVNAGAVDELCLSISPLLVGPGSMRIIDGARWPLHHAMRLTDLLEEDGALFARYRLDRD